MAVIRGTNYQENIRKEFSDQIILGSWRGINYLRRRWVQPYSNSEAQAKNRELFAEAIKSYQGLTSSEKKAWQQLARELDYSGTGYNLFISCYLKGQDRLSLELPERAHPETAGR